MNADFYQTWSKEPESVEYLKTLKGVVSALRTVNILRIFELNHDSICFL